jgi:hypothetical protein
MAQQRSSHLMEREPSGLAPLAPAAWLSTIAACQREMLEFMSHRLEKDGETMREAITCRNLGDALAVQTRWIDETLRDYSNEATRLLEIYTGAGEHADQTTRRS